MSLLQFKTAKPRFLRLDNGFVLIVVLLLLTIASITTSQIASNVIRQSGMLASKQRELRSRWATVSIRRAFLRKAEVILMAPPQKNVDNAPAIPDSVSGSISLNGVQYSYSISDESAKLNVQRCVTAFNQEQLRPVLRNLVDGEVLIQPVVPKKICYWNDLFQLSTNSGGSLDHTTLRKKLTLWSDGKINIVTCRAETLDSIWGLGFGRPAPSELQAVRGKPTPAVQTVIAGMQGLSESEVKFALNWLSTRSSTYSISVTENSVRGLGFSASYIRRTQEGYSEENFGVHFP